MNDNMMQVTRRPYKDTDTTLPLIGFGMMRLPQSEEGQIDKNTARAMVDLAMNAGVNYFDTAWMYHGGESEKCCGEILSEYPRDSYFLADKMPVWSAEDEAGQEAIFEEQLKRCRTDYFDFYLIHSMSAATWDTVKKLNTYEFLSRKKAEGKIRKLGFSFHDTPEVLKEIAAARPWDFVQIQLNYLDWELYRSREQYEILSGLGIPVIVMEPIRGGALATLNPAATEILKNADQGASNASWALRYVASLPGIICVLSGMSLLEQVEDNLATFTPFKPLTDKEQNILSTALAAYQKNLAVPCTACRYCMPCPFGVDIATIFGNYNQYKVSGNKWGIVNTYKSLPETAKVSSCVSCGKCMEHCPQHIKIPQELKKIEEEIQTIKL